MLGVTADVCHPDSSFKKGVLAQLQDVWLADSFQLLPPSVDPGFGAKVTLFPGSSGQ